MKKTRKNRREASGAVCDDRCAAVVLEQGRDDALRNVGVDFRRALGIIEGRVEPPTSRLQTEELAHSILPDPRTYNLLAFRENNFLATTNATATTALTARKLSLISPGAAITFHHFR